MEKGQGKRTDTLQTDNVFTRKEYIEREAAYDTLTGYYHHSTDIQHGALREALNRVPAADVVSVQHGRWIDDKVAFYLGCSECGCYLEYAVDTFLDGGDHYHYCPNCGALMDKGGDGE